MKRGWILTSKIFILIIFVAGIGYLLALQLLVSNDTYFSGDSGLKSLLTQNIASGNLGFDIKFSEPAWVKTLWEQGLFPYQKPFIYQVAGKYYITFPYTFSLVNAPFYALWGYRGLYFIPLLATFGIWIFFYLLCKKLDLRPFSIGIGLLVLIFTTNLTLYSAIFWEHTLAIFLSFAGFYWMFRKPGSQSISSGGAILGGIFSGLAVWFRPEQIFLVVFISLISLPALYKSFRSRIMKRSLMGMTPEYAGKSDWIYPLCSLLTLCLYGLTNWLIYRNFLGMHSVQVIDQKQALVQRLITFLDNIRLFTVGNVSLFAYVPISLFPLVYWYFAKIKPGQFKYGKSWNTWYIFCPFFLIGVALLVPAGAGGRQWGPRFLLFLVPLLMLLFTWQLDFLLKAPIKTYGVTGRIGASLVLIMAGVGIIQNPVRGSIFLEQTYSQEKSTLTEMRSEKEQVVAVSSQFLTQLYQPAVSRNVSFLEAATQEDLSKLCNTLVTQNIHSFSYLCYSFDCKLFRPDQKNKEITLNGISYNLKMRNAKEFGIYAIYDINLFPKP